MMQTIHWTKTPGRLAFIGYTSGHSMFGDRSFKTSIGHGGIWHAFEIDSDSGRVIEYEGFCGPECARRARQWCETRLSVAPEGRFTRVRQQQQDQQA